MRSVRDWSVRHAHRLARLYVVFEHLIVAIEPLARLIGHERLERPVAAVERTIKGALFDCRMCGACVLSSTGMSCPRNCPKNVLNGPCGGVRADGSCEVLPDMTCVWVKAIEGDRNMGGGTIGLLPATDHRLIRRSSWLNILRQRAKGSAQ